MPQAQSFRWFGRVLFIDIPFWQVGLAQDRSGMLPAKFLDSAIDAFKRPSDTQRPI
jgi:hypothetical protein